MSVGGPYALACAARHPDRVTAVGIVAAPALVPALDPPWPRDELSPDEQEFFAGLAATPVDESVERMRPEFEQYVARVAPDDPDDAALVRRWVGGLHPLDVALLEALPVAESPSRCASHGNLSRGTRRSPSRTREAPNWSRCRWPASR